MQICSKCLYPSTHPFGITFNSQGICSGCIVHEEKDTLDWDLRKKKLSKILSIYRNKSKSNYDCIIPVSGGKDSYFIVDLIKNEFKMNPLLVSYNTHFNTLVGITNLQNLKTKLGCDLIQLNLDPKKVQEICKYTFRKFGSIYWHNHAGLTVFPVQMSVKLKIPLIIWGAHQGIEQVGMFSHTDEVVMTRKYRKEHDLLGKEPEDLYIEKDCPEGVKKLLRKYFYPSSEDIKNVQVKGIYLGNYIRWDSKLQHEKMIRKFNYKATMQYRTFNTYEDPHSAIYNDIHDYIKYLKLGYSKVLDHAVIEIRHKRISRDYAIKLIKEYSMNKIPMFDNFCQYLGISKNEFHQIISKFTLSIPLYDDYFDGIEYKNEKSSIKNNLDYIINCQRDQDLKMHSFFKGIYL
jgi:N-acetyl sugar amidotransferase